jgi:hypothetical protein
LGTLIFSDKRFQAANGEVLNWREYLDAVIKAFNLNPYDYYAAQYVLSKINEGQKGSEVADLINKMWDKVKEIYRPLNLHSKNS